MDLDLTRRLTLSPPTILITCIQNAKNTSETLKNSFFFGKCLTKSTGLDFDPETVPGSKIQYLSFPKLIYPLLYGYS